MKNDFFQKIGLFFFRKIWLYIPIREVTLVTVFCEDTEKGELQGNRRDQCLGLKF